MSTFRTARDAVRAMWASHWPAPAGVPVYWHDGTENILPDAGTVTHWLRVAIEFDADDVRAFGGGFGANDRVLFGSVTIRVFTAAGIGEDAALDLLSDAMAALRSRRSGDGNLSFIGTNTFRAAQAVMDGAWWRRSALVSFEFRYQG
jgi:hypothetical protein